MDILLFLLVFVIMFLNDWLWTVYIMYAARHEAFKASLASSAIVAIGAIATVAYLENRWSIVPAILGGGLGTFLAIYLDKRNKK